MQYEIGIWFLLLSLVIPRITLFLWWMTGNLPYNTTPLVADFFGTLFIPRLLILVYIYGIQGFSAWFIVHLIALGISTIFKCIYVINEKS